MSGHFPGLPVLTSKTVVLLLLIHCLLLLPMWYEGLKPESKAKNNKIKADLYLREVGGYA